MLRRRKRRRGEEKRRGEDEKERERETLAAERVGQAGKSRTYEVFAQDASRSCTRASGPEAGDSLAVACRLLRAEGGICA
jgi:phage-related baseplate assembly protein